MYLFIFEGQIRGHLRKCFVPYKAPWKKDSLTSAAWLSFPTLPVGVCKNTRLSWLYFYFAGFLG